MPRKTEIIYGIHTVRHALRRSPEAVLELLLQDGRQDTEEINEIVDLAQKAGISIQHMSRGAIEKLSGNVPHQGVLIRRRTKTGDITSLDSLFEDSANPLSLLLVLDGIQDPHNLGACLRTANATAVDAVIITRDRSVSLNATVSKIASGAAEHTPVISVTNLARALEQLKQHGIWCFGLAEAAESDLFATDLTVPLALVLGAEGRGLRHNTRNHCDKLIKIPMLGEVESLNVSVATGIVLYEALRQRLGR